MEDSTRTAVEAEVRAAFDGYEAALGANDVAALTGYFWESPRAVRMMTEGGLYGIDEIAAFRKGRDVSDVARDLTRVDDRRARRRTSAVATAEYRRTGSGKRGRAEPGLAAPPRRLAHRLGACQPRAAERGRSCRPAPR